MHKSVDIQHVASLLQEWVQGLALAAFEYAAGFRIRLESLGTVPQYAARRFPTVAIIDLFADWWLDDASTWHAQIAQFAGIMASEPIEEPVQAYYLMQLVGKTIIKADILADGSLQLCFSSGQTITVTGRTDIWEESWIIDPPPDIPHYNQWSIWCEATGAVQAKWRDAADYF